MGEAMTGPASQHPPLAWYRGAWGTPGELSLPLNDRGLQWADGLFETVLIERGRPQLLGPHLERWQRSAALLGMDTPPGQAELQPLINTAVARCGGADGPPSALRLNWSRGTAPQGGRGLDLPAAGEAPLEHRFWLQLQPISLAFGAVSTVLSRDERRNATSVLSRCKTFAYGQAIQARLEARRRGAEDALLLGSNGDLCCGSTANLLVHHGGRWLTPPLESGCLPGVMRQRALEAGLAQEAPLGTQHLTEARAVLLINSLGCRVVARFEDRDLTTEVDPEGLWRGLL